MSKFVAVVSEDVDKNNLTRNQVSCAANKAIIEMSPPTRIAMQFFETKIRLLNDEDILSEDGISNGLIDPTLVYYCGKYLGTSEEAGENNSYSTDNEIILIRNFLVGVLRERFGNKMLEIIVTKKDSKNALMGIFSYMFQYDLMIINYSAIICFNKITKVDLSAFYKPENTKNNVKVSSLPYNLIETKKKSHNIVIK